MTVAHLHLSQKKHRPTALLRHRRVVGCIGHKFGDALCQGSMGDGVAAERQLVVGIKGYLKHVTLLHHHLLFRVLVLRWRQLSCQALVGVHR